MFDVQLVEKWLMDYGTQMRRQLELKLNQMRTRLMHDEEKLRYLNPRAKLKENERRLDELGAALERRIFQEDWTGCRRLRSWRRGIPMWRMPADMR